MLGPLWAVAILSPAWGRAESAWAGLAVALCGGVLIGLASLAGARLARGLEGERPASAALAWTGASLLLAGLARSVFGEGGRGAWMGYAAVAIGTAMGAMGLLARAPGGLRAPRTRFGGLLAALTVTATAAPFWPSWLPWLLAERELPMVESWPPSFVFVALETPGPRDEAREAVGLASLALLRTQAVVYPVLFPEPVLSSLLSLPDGSLLAEQLHARGFATAAIGIVPERLRDLAIEEVDDRPGGRRLLEGAAAWMGGASLLLSPASPLLRLLGHGESFRSAKEVGDEAARWLLGWRTTRAPTPFLLLVDLRAAEGSAEAVDRVLRRILSRLHDLELDRSTILVLAVETRAVGEDADALRALVLLPTSWSPMARSEVEPRVWGRALSRSLLEIAASDGKGAVRLAGLPEELEPRSPR